MGFLYKLVDKKEIEFANEGLISLSHPIFEFKGSEGKFINFAKRIYAKYKKRGLNLNPSKTDLNEIKEWIEAYSTTYGKGWSDEHINSESMIIFCGIMQGFCGYFTTIDLLDSNKLNSYCSKSRLKGKEAVLRLDDTIFEYYHHWRTSDLQKPFCPFDGDPSDLQDYNGYTHPTKIVYNAHFDDYKELLKIYNRDEVRHSSNWFNNLSDIYEWQQEERIIFLLESLEKNSSRIGCDSVFKRPINNYEELVYCKIVDAIDYCEKGPRFIYLNVGRDNLKLLNINEILKNS